MIGWLLDGADLLQRLGPTDVLQKLFSNSAVQLLLLSHWYMQFAPCTQALHILPPQAAFDWQLCCCSFRFGQLCHSAAVGQIYESVECMHAFGLVGSTSLTHS